MWAQDASRSANAIELDEVVVTSRRQSEQLLDVPLAITAFTAEAIEQRGITNLDDVAANTPGLTFSNVLGEFLPAPVIRGVAPIDILGELNTAVFVDGIYVSGREGVNFSQLDIERIEVVKGPQAALYGRNAFGGAINYVTAKPTDEFRGKTQVTVGNDGRALGSVAVSGALIPGVLRGRAAVLHDEFDGSYENAWAGRGPGSDIGGYKFKTFNGALAWSPNDAFEAELGLYVSADRIDNAAVSQVVANCEDRRTTALATNPMSTVTSRLLNYCGELPSIDENSLSALPGATGEDRDLTRAHLALRWNVAGGTLSALSGYSKVDQSFFIDGSRNSGETTIFTYQPAPAINIPMLGTQSGPRQQFSTGLLIIGRGDGTEEFSQEIRFASDREQRLRYSVGGFYFSNKRVAGEDGVLGTRPLPANFGSFCLACTALGPTTIVDFAPGAGNGAFLEWFTDPLGGSSEGIYRFKTDSAAVFAQAEFDFTDRLTGSIEGRYTDEERSFDDRATNVSVEDSWGLANWRATLRFKPTDAVTFFAGVAQSEKSGDFDPTTVRFVDAPTVDVTVPGAFDPEKILSYELGVKAELFDRRIGVEFDIYKLDWSDIVIPQIRSDVGGRAIIQPTAFNVNGGDASVQGAEFMIVARPARGVDLNFGLAYVDAQYDDARVQSFIEFPSFAPNGDVSGNTILRTSEWQGNAGARYSAPARGDTEWFVRGDLAYRGKQYADATNQAIIPAATTLNASIGLTNDSWTLELWGRNLTDEDAPSGAFRDAMFTNTLPSGVNTGGTFFPFRWNVAHPRLLTYGVTWRMRF
ncbi:MAG: TonB-dependent receptor [Gammaproteobacteria bacterium]|nr:TonB-dependent receptor [Gammaproteobacteria bacterium]